MLDIPRSRLQIHQISHPVFSKIKDLAGWMCATQAQDYTHAKWGLGLRLPGTTEAEVEAAFERGELIRTHLLRPTWHVVAVEDVRWLLRLSAPQILRMLSAMGHHVGLDEEKYRFCLPILIEALETGRHLTREELMTELEKRDVQIQQYMPAHLMMRAELDEIVCNGSPRGRLPTYTLLDRKAPPLPAFDRRAAIGELARRYFRSHAPATLKDFHWWSGLSMPDARTGLEAAQPELVSETIDNQAFWLPNDFREQPFEETPDLRLLPAFDEFLVSYKDRSASLPPERNKQVITVNGVFKPVLVVDGRVRGTWQRIFKKGKVTFEHELFSPLGEAETEALNRVEERFSAFLNF